jgi:uncharacterized Tic20 family protein
MSHSPQNDDPLQSVKDFTGDSTMIIALLGAFVSLITGFIPFSPLIGGGLAGWLVRDDETRAVKVAGLSGLILALPVAFIFVPVFGLALLGGPRVGIAFLLLTFFVVALALFYTAGISAIGGYIGVRLYQSRVANATGTVGRDTSGSRSRDDAYDRSTTGRDDDTTTREDDTTFDTGWSDERTTDDRDTDRDTEF